MIFVGSRHFQHFAQIQTDLLQEICPAWSRIAAKGAIQCGNDTGDSIYDKRDLLVLQLNQI